MNYTFTHNKGDGTTVVFPFSFAGQNEGYLRTSDIVVEVDGTSVPFTIRANDPNRVYLSSAPANGAEVLIRRIMPKEIPYADFARGNPFSQDTLNNSFLQQLYLTQEILDGYLPDGFYFRQDVDMHGNKFINLGRGAGTGDSINWDQHNELDLRIEGIEDAIKVDDPSVRTISFRFTATEGQTVWTPGIKFNNAYVFLSGLFQNKLDGAFTVNNNSIIFPEPLQEGTKIYGLLGTGPKLPDAYLTQDELVSLYFNGIYQRLTDLDDTTQSLSDDLVSTKVLLNALAVRVTPVDKGGTGGNTAAAARTNLSAASSGSNSDITSLSGLSTPLSSSQGGTGNNLGRAASALKLSTAVTLRTNLASTNAASFDGSTGVTPGVQGTLPIANGGTGATTASAGLTALGGLAAAGVKDASEATAGNVGEYMQATSADTAITSGVTKGLVSVTLTPGDWDLQGVISLVPNGATMSTIVLGLGTVNGTQPTDVYSRRISRLSTGGTIVTDTPVVRFNVSVNTTVYLNSFIEYMLGSLNASGRIRARRVR